MKSFPPFYPSFAADPKTVNSCTPIDHKHLLARLETLIPRKCILPISYNRLSPRIDSDINRNQLMNPTIKYGDSFPKIYQVRSWTLRTATYFRYFQQLVFFFNPYFFVLRFPPGTLLGSSPGGLPSTRSTAGLCRNHRDHTQTLKVCFGSFWFYSFGKFWCSLYQKYVQFIKNYKIEVFLPREFILCLK